jgi:3-methyladenine DNA glycosylase AlkC
MAEKLKNLFFTKIFINQLGSEIQNVYHSFNKNKFLSLIQVAAWDNMELKQRMRHISESMNQTLPPYPEALKILEQVSSKFTGFNAMIFPDFVEKFGLEYRDISLRALWLFTKQCSSEFAIRPFLLRDLHQTMQQMYDWADDEDPMVRRLASEGCRPRLPWAMALPELKKDPGPIFPILEKLKDDKSESVRRSVANNLNDISKDHPGLVLEICQRWFGKSENVDKLIKHACRDMLKSGNKEALRLFGFVDPHHVAVDDFMVSTNSVKIGESIVFSFRLKIAGQKPVKIRLEYIIHFVKSNGRHSPKVFQIKEGNFKAGSHNIQKKHSFQDFSTRKHYPGQHTISIIINGEQKAKAGILVQ